MRVFCSHGNEFFANVSVGTFKFINRHVHPPEMAINPGILLWIIGHWVFILWGKLIHSILFVKENQVMIIEILLDRIAAGNVKIINIFRY